MESRLRAPFRFQSLLVIAGCTFSLGACKVDTGGSMSTDSFGEVTGDDTNAGEEASTGGDSDCPDDGCLDIVGGSGQDGGEGTGGDCDAPVHTPCDDGDADLLNALGLNCPDEGQYEVGSWGSGMAFGTLTGYGDTGAFTPTEGSRFAVIGSGRVADLPNYVDPLDPNAMVFDNCSSDLGAFDPGNDLPLPIVASDVGAVTCTEDMSLIGTGDCSNTLQQQFLPPGTDTPAPANDYTELRFTATVPGGATSLSYDFAFLSHEYPGFWQSTFNDMYIGWLESETWTGNISFDENGAPITVNAGFMDYLDADSSAFDIMSGNEIPHPDCPPGANCSAPELHGTCMQGHGATRWLTTTAPVNPGTEITLVFAIMDLSDSVLDSYVFLDNFQWGCIDGMPPTTIPID
jgi:hypothetical protein